MLSYSREGQIGQSALIVTGIFTSKGPLASTERNVYTLAQVLVWTITLVAFLNIDEPGLLPFGVFWIGGLSVEIALFALTLEYHVPRISLEWAQYGLEALRIIIVLFLLSAVIQGLARRSHDKASDEEAAPLLVNTQDASDETHPATAYGSLAANATTQKPNTADNDSGEDAEHEVEDEDAKKEREDLEKMKNHIKEKGGWFAYAKDFSVSSLRLALLDCVENVIIHD